MIRVLDALPARPLLAGEEGLRLSLAGAQSMSDFDRTLMSGVVRRRTCCDSMPVNVLTRTETARR